LVRNEDVNGLDKGVSSFVFSLIASPLQEYKNKKVSNKAGFKNFIWLIVWFNLILTHKKYYIRYVIWFGISNTK
jgi:hypothetical protein